MIFGLNREKAKETILRLINLQDNEMLQNVYRQISDTSDICTMTVLKVWNKIEPLDSLDDAQLDELLKLCLVASGSNAYEDYRVEVDTSPIKMAYFETVSGPETKDFTMHFLELFTEIIESVYHKDLCQLSRDEAIEGLSRLPNLNAATLRKALTVARGYCKYCVDHGVFNGRAINSFENVFVDDVPIDAWVAGYIVKDPAALVSRIENVVSINSGSIVPVVLVVAWMRFSLDECVEIKEKDVDLFKKTICGEPIPEEMIQIVVSYANVTFDGNDNSFFLKKMQKKKRGTQCSKTYVGSVLNVMDGFSYKNAVMSSILYGLHKKDSDSGKVTEQDIIDSFKLSSNSTSFLSYLKDKKRLYSTYKRIYWTS